ncbi:hypothetical protein OG588_31605 [Streptomyces prunicolor]|uniref:hypothetical protein n=1 Tax=Streptomyces prunicolor TaxID=67348 RepID=UPI00386545A4|nr:hypothetical protein OG588_31605 [Streptomyces prunicolor]
MSDRGGNDMESSGETGDIRRSRLSDYAEMSTPEPPPAPPAGRDPLSSDVVARGRREFAVLLGEFRRTAVLVPTDEDDAPLVGDFGGIRWIYAFSNESALARFAIARGEVGQEWPYQRLLGARLLDATVPAVNAAGVPCGVALDVGTEGEGALFPPVLGIVPEAAAVDADTDTDGIRG